MKRKIIYVDMDDTICDYTNAFNESRERRPDLVYPQSQYGFYMDLKPINESVSSVLRLDEIFDVYVLTRPSYQNPMCYTEKRVWIERHFGLEFCKKLIICYDKALLMGDILIDDVLWPGFLGEQIHFGSAKFNDWNKVMNYLIK